MTNKYIFQLLSAVLFLTFSCPIVAQEELPLYVDEEECGCDLYFIDGIQKTYKNGKFGFKRYDGKILVPNIYDHTDKFQNGYCKVVRDTLCGMIDSTGKEVIPCLYQDVDYYRNGLARFQKDNKYGFLDINANVNVHPPYQVIHSSFFPPQMLWMQLQQPLSFLLEILLSLLFLNETAL